MTFENESNERPVHVWADSFGTYYANVELPEGDATPEGAVRRIAAKAIRAELGDQIGKGYRMRLVYVGMKTVADRPGVIVSVYREAN